LKIVNIKKDLPGVVKRMDEIKLKKIMLDRGIDIVNAESIEQKSLAFERALRIIIQPKNVSDRTAFRNITQWITKKCQDGKFNENAIYRRVIDFAIEASGPNSRNPAAVFISILKKELGYLKDDRLKQNPK